MVPTRNPDAGGSLDAHVGVRFSQLTVDVGFSVAPGEILGLVGPNGAGKTTVLRAIAGLQPLDFGHVTIGGVLMDDPTAGVLVTPQRRGVAVVFQDYRLFPHLDALDNVAFALRARGTAKREARAEALAWLERLGLADHRHHRPAQLSGGQSQRVALARALAATPDVLLLDEPLAAIDPASRERIRDELAGHLAGFAGVTILVSHQLDDVRRLAAHAIALEGGTIAWRGAAEALPRAAAGGTAMTGAVPLV